MLSNISWYLPLNHEPSVNRLTQIRTIAKESKQGVTILWFIAKQLEPQTWSWTFRDINNGQVLDCVIALCLVFEISNNQVTFNWEIWSPIQFTLLICRCTRLLKVRYSEECINQVFSIQITYVHLRFHLHYLMGMYVTELMVWTGPLACLGLFSIILWIRVSTLIWNPVFTQY